MITFTSGDALQFTKKIFIKNINLFSWENMNFSEAATGGVL